MEPISINRTAADLKQQIDFLIKREFFITYHGYKKIFIYLIGCTLAVLALSILTDNNSLVTFKVVSICLTAIAWILGLVVLAAIIIKRQKRIKWRNTTIKSFLAKNIKGYLTFDKEKMTLITDNYKSEIKWDYYKFYTEHKNSIFFIPGDNLYEALYFSSADIGQENFLQLKDIAKSRLAILDGKSGK